MPSHVLEDDYVSDNEEFFRVESDITHRHHGEYQLEANTDGPYNGIQKDAVGEDAYKPAAQRGRKQKHSAPKFPKVAVKKSALAPAPRAATVVRLGEPAEDGFDGNLPPISGISSQVVKKTNVPTKRRGRPSNVSLREDAAADEEPLEKKIRGQPATEANNVLTKRRGRPSNVSVREDAAADEEPLEKKLRAQPATEADNDEEEEPTTPTRRGRPPKAKPNGLVGTKDDNEMKKPIGIPDLKVDTTSRPSRAAALSAKTSITLQSSNRSQMAVISSSNAASSSSGRAQNKGKGKAKSTNKRPGRKQSVFEVEKLVDSKGNSDGTKSYFVKWVNYASTQNTWEPLKNLSGCLDMVEAFDQKQAKRKSPSKAPLEPKSKVNAKKRRASLEAKTNIKTMKRKT